MVDDTQAQLDELLGGGGKKSAATAEPDHKAQLEELLSGGPRLLPDEQIRQGEDEARYGSLAPGRPKGATRGSTDDAAKKYYQEEDARAMRGYVARNSRPGVPLDIQTGLPAGKVAAFGLRKDPQDQQAYLEAIYGPGKVRQADDGNFIVEVTGRDGKPVDMAVVPSGPEPGQLAKQALSGSRSALKFASTVGAALLTDGASIPLQIGAMAGADAAAGAATDVATRAMDKQPIRPGDIAADAAITAGTDIAVPALINKGGALLEKGGKAALRAATAPLAGGANQPIIKNSAEAIKYMADKFGENYVPTTGEKTGWPLLLRTEAFNENMIGGGALQKKTLLRDQTEMRLQSKMTGAIRNESDIGKDVIASATSDLQKTNAQITSLQAKAHADASEAIAREFEQNSLASNPMTTVHEKAQAVKDRVEQIFEQSKQAASDLHEQFWASVPGGDAEVVPIKTVKNIIDELKAGNSKAAESLSGGASKVLNLPKVMAKENEVDDKILGEFEQELRDADQSGQKFFSLKKAAQLRSIIGDQVGSPNLTTSDPSLGYLKKAYSAVSTAMKEGIDTLPEDSRALWEKAQQATKQHHATFEQSGVKNLLSQDVTGGGAYIEPRQLVAQIGAGPGSIDKLLKLKQVLGENSGDYNLLKRAVFDDALDRANIEGFPGTVDGGRLMAIVDQWHPEVREELLGAGGQKLLNNANVLKQLQSSSIDRETLASILADKDAPHAAATLQKALAISDARDARFKSELMQKLAGGDLTQGRSNPSEIVHRVIFKATPTEAGDMMAMIRAADPKLAKDVENRAVASILEDASVAPTPEMMAARNSGQSGFKIDATKLDRIINDRTQAERLTNVIGKERMEDLKQYLNMILPQANKSALFGSAGQLAKGMVIASLERGKVGKFVDAALHFNIISQLITSDAFDKAAMAATKNKIEPAVSKWMDSKVGKIATSRAIARGITLAPSFTRALVDTAYARRPGDHEQEKQQVQDLLAEDFATLNLPPADAPASPPPDQDE